MTQEEFGFAKALDAIHKAKTLVDVVGGPMTSKDAGDEFRHLLTREHEYVIAVAERMPGNNLYRTTLYITKDDFEKPLKQIGLDYGC